MQSNDTPIQQRSGRKRRRSHSMKALTPTFITQAITFIVLRGNHEGAVDAISANPNPIIQYEYHESGNSFQPHQKQKPIYMKGDESYHWYEDEDGYTIIDDPDDYRIGDNITSREHHKVYAGIDPTSGNLTSTGVRLGMLSDTTINTIGLKKHTKQPVNLQRSNCGLYCEGNPSSSTSRHKVRGSSSTTHSSRGRAPLFHHHHHRNLLQGEEHLNRRKLMTSTNALKNLVVLIRFSDHQDRILPSVADYDVLLNGPGGSGTIAPTGSVNDVFHANSYGQFSLESTIYPWITLSKSESYYTDNSSGLSTKIFEAIHEALGVVDADTNFDISQFNTDYNEGDSFIDAITIFHSGYGAEFGGSDCYGTGESGRVWSHSWFMSTGAWTSQDGKVSVMNYHINPGLWSTCGSDISRIGVVAHETTHFLGLPDLYDPSGGNGIGIYCLMSDS